MKRHSTKKIRDDIALLDLSPQRRYQLRRKREGRCTICGRKAYLQTQLCYNCSIRRGTKNPGMHSKHKQAGVE
jgi:hypothetical protein